jgi:aconitate hydratase
VIRWVARELGVSGGTNAVLEYIGPGARTLSATGKATIANMGAEVGATTSVFPADDHMLAYLRATGRAEIVPLVERHGHLLAPDPEVEQRPERHYDRVLRLDLSRLEPHVAGPCSPDRARPISALAAEVRASEVRASGGAGRRAAQAVSGALVDAISTALIGSCTNSSYEDMSRAADIARQASRHGLRAAAPLLVTPGSERVRATLERDGLMQPLRDVGAVVLASACGPCIGQWRRSPEAAGSANTIVTSYNRNFPARNDGQAATMSFLASPEIVTALAIGGRLSFNPLTDTLIGADGEPFKLDPPARAPEVPARGLEPGRRGYVAPPADGHDLAVPLDPASERLQRIPRWPAWDGRDLLDMPVLMKTAGKTTTDHISPAGPWLRYRGHLDRFSENLLSGAVNAFTGRVGKGSGGLGASAIARSWRARGIKWVIVGDANYGEGSSREHAALSPRLLNGAAVLARSFARIHETNLKKQGLLALTFSDPSDYERILEHDRLSLVGLGELAPGAPVRCIVEHADGTRETLLLRHSYSASQIAWFRAGSALNSCR